ncbi:hypothetical protein QBC39DRAFT_252062 [Podospora conica]|nr:hypothetical protein QBC39DRAFT_252062 [Schizothecium conicum]
MCREVVFSGTCSRCAGVFVWAELAQQLSCLEAKNTGIFGCCRRGVHREDHTFDRECEPCAMETEADEGYGGMESEAAGGQQVLGARKTADRGGAEDARKKKRQRTS